MKHTTTVLLAALALLLGCKKEQPDPCYRCIQLIRYTTTSPTFTVPSPSSLEIEACSDAERAKIEGTTTTTVPLSGTYSYSKIVSSTCIRKQ